MKIFARFMHWVTGHSTSVQPGSQRSDPSSSAHEDSTQVGPDAALQISTVWACVTILTETIAHLPFFVYRKDSEGLRQKPETIRIYQILHRRPNPRQTTQEFWEQMLLNFWLRGNMYARMVRDAKGELLSLWPLSADQVEVRLIDDRLFYYYYYDNQTYIYTERDILHIRDIGNGLVGMSRIDYMRSSLGLAIDAQNHSRKKYRQNGRRPGILMSDVVLDPEQRSKLKENFGDIVNGTDRELYILEAQFKFEPLGMTPADLQLLETRKFSVQDICRWFGVPSVLVNDTGETTALGSSVDQIIRAFFKMKISPQLNRIETAINERLMSPGQRSQGLYTEFNFNALLRASLDERMKSYSTAVQNGLKTRNECRALENDPPLEGGDKLTAQSNLFPVDQLGTQPMTTGNVPEQPVQQ